MLAFSARARAQEINKCCRFMQCSRTGWKKYAIRILRYNAEELFRAMFASFLSWVDTNESDMIAYALYNTVPHVLAPTTPNTPKKTPPH